MILSSFFYRCPKVFLSFLLLFPVLPVTSASAATILARQYITNTVHIAGGTYTTPYIISSPNTEYILDGDITANGTAIAIRASRVVLNLNGKTVTYNQTIPGEGVTIDTYNLSDVAITNGSILQGAALSEGDVYGAGNNPIKTVGVQRVQITGINAKYGGRDVGGFKLSAYESIIEENTLEDLWTVGTLKNRMQGVDAIACATGTAVTSNQIRNNTIINARHRGISAFGKDQVYGNTISINSLATNSCGIFGYQTHDVKVHTNRITARGEHPIGIGFVSAGTKNIEIYNNIIDAQTTRIGEEYGGSSACFNSSTPCGNYAVGFRTTWGGNNISFHDNTITVHTDSAYRGTYSPTGQTVLVNGKGRGLMVEVNAGESSRFYNNTISVLDKDGTGKAFGIACTGGNMGDMTFEGNTVTSNIFNVVLSDEYGSCGGYPLFVKNTFVQADNYPAYRTIAAELNGYWESTGRFISNAYQGGAAENKLGMNFQYRNKNKSIIFGRLMEGVVRDASGTFLANMGVNTYTGNNLLQTSAITGADGKAQIMVYDYELNNNNGLTQSAVPITVAFRPHIMELHDSSISQSLFKSQPDSRATAWDALTSSGSYTLGDSSHSITLSATAGAFVPPPMDATAPTVAIVSPTASTVSGPVTVSVSASDNVAIAKVELYVNGVLQGTDPAPGPYSFTWNTATVTNSSFTLLAKAYDAAGNVGLSAPTVVTVNNPLPDTTAPVVSLTAPANNATVAGTITVSATATDAGGVSRVDFYVDGVFQAAANTASYRYSLDTRSLANGSHVLTSIAYDKAGNKGQASITVLVNNATADTSPPTISFTSPTPNAALRGTVTLSAAAADNVGVAKVEFYLNSTLLRTISNGPYTFTWDTVPYYNYTSCTLTAKAYDTAGNVGQSQIIVQINNDKTAPIVTSFTTPDPEATLTFPVSVLASDDVMVTGYKITESNVTPSAGAAGWSSTVPTSYTAASVGSHTLYAWAKDAAGNVSAPMRANTPVDTAAPKVSFAAPAQNAVLTGVVTLAAAASDDVGVVKVEIYFNSTRLTTITKAPYSFVWNTTPYYNYSSCTLTAKAYDAVGNVGQSQITVQIKNDKAAPTVTSFTVPAAVASLTVPVSELVASDNVKVTGYSITESSVTPLASSTVWSSERPVSYNAVSEGSHTLYAWAKDAAGNVSAPKTAQVTIALLPLQTK